MSSLSPESPPDLVSKVTFSPVSDSTGNQALIVTIKRVVSEVEEIPKIMDTPKVRSSSADAKRSDSKRKTRSRSSPNNKSTMTEKRQERSFETQTAVSLTVPEATSSHRHKHDSKTVSSPTSLSSKYSDSDVTSCASSMSRMKLDSGEVSGPCLKHAAENIKAKASTIESDKVSLCNNCSKSMLSYIFVVQDFLDSLAKEICGNANAQDCLQCLRQETRMAMSAVDVGASNVHVGERRSSKSRTKDGRVSKSGEDSPGSKKSTRSKEQARDVRRYEETSEKLIERSISQHRQVHQQDPQKYEQNTNSPEQRSELHSDQQTIRTYSQMGEQQTQRFARSQDQQGDQGNQGPWTHQAPNDKQSDNQTYSGHSEHRSHQGPYEHHASYHSNPDGSNNQSTPSQEESMHSQLSSDPDDTNFSQQAGEDIPFRRPIHRQRPDFVFHRDQDERRDESSKDSNFQSSVSSPFSEGVDGIVSTLSNAEREVYDAARNGAGWEGLSEAQERLVSSSSTPIPSEAYVTMCRNNAEALGCLVVGTSLLLSRTTRTLCVVVSDGVSNAFRGPLSSVFHVVQCVRSMDSLGTTKLALLEQPELGVSFEKLNVWRLIQFNKCVFLNPDTLVIQNCDELFCRDELSAVADIGWPDCFNSGMFVFVPSHQTFWQLLEYAEKQGSYDGGDQGLLNSYFNSWSEDISKKLSFIYNLMANVSYTYTPAFKQFGRNVKVVQFHGSFKPWHVKFFSRTGQISSETAVHPTYVQFVHIWINIFRISAIRQLPQDIRSYAQSQDLICAVELLRFFPLPTESEAEFFLTPPSVRLGLAERKLQKTVIQHREEAKRRKSAEFSTRLPPDDEEDVTTREKDVIPRDIDVTKRKTDAGNKVEVDGMAESTPIVDSASGSETVKPAQVENPLPGSEVGNYQGMKAWEQGRMDYQGTDSSDTIIKRLDFLMTQPK